MNGLLGRSIYAQFDWLAQERMNSEAYVEVGMGWSICVL